MSTPQTTDDLDLDDLTGIDQAEYRTWRIRLGLYALVCIFMAVILLSVLGEAPLWLGVVLGGPVFMLLLAFVPLIRRQIRFFGLFATPTRNFAAANGFEYQTQAKFPKDMPYVPAIAKIGWFDRQEQVVSGEFAGYPFRTYVDTFRHPFANRWTRVSTRVFEFDLPKVVPHMYIATRRPFGNEYVTDVMRHFDDDQRIPVEGNFEDLFITYTHRRTTTDALSILAPNVLESIISTNTNYTVEFIGNKLYLYAADIYPNSEDFREGFRVAARLLKHLDRRLRSLKFVIPNEKKYPFLKSRPGFGTMQIGGKYFSASIVSIGAYTLYSLGRIYLMHGDQSRPVVISELVVVVVSDIVMIVFLLIKRSQYEKIAAED